MSRNAKRRFSVLVFACFVAISSVNESKAGILFFFTDLFKDESNCDRPSWFVRTFGSIDLDDQIFAGAFFATIGTGFTLLGILDEDSRTAGIGIGAAFIALGEGETGLDAFPLEAMLRSRYPEIDDLATYKTLSREVSDRFRQTSVISESNQGLHYRYVTVPAERVSLALDALFLDPSDSARIVADLAE